MKVVTIPGIIANEMPHLANQVLHLVIVNLRRPSPLLCIIISPSLTMQQCNIITLQPYLVDPL